jgi:hypothetical protein
MVGLDGRGDLVAGDGVGKKAGRKKKVNNAVNAGQQLNVYLAINAIAVPLPLRQQRLPN